MKNQSGKSPLSWIVIITVSLIIGGVIIAMIFGNTSEVPNILNQIKIENESTNNVITTKNKKL